MLNFTNSKFSLFSALVLSFRLTLLVCIGSIYLVATCLIHYNIFVMYYLVRLSHGGINMKDELEMLYTQNRNELVFPYIS
ncbi:hypothetical protein ACJX0J_040160, partial [Zea mays]